MIKPPKMHVLMCMMPLVGECGICDTGGQWLCLDLDLRRPLCSHCVEVARVAEIELRAAGLEWPSTELKEVNP